MIQEELDLDASVSQNQEFLKETPDAHLQRQVKQHHVTQETKKGL
jgi:hypothetical protein